MGPENYDAWLFDLDGTVVDAEWSYVRDVFDRTGDRLGYEFSDEQAEDLWHGLTDTREDHLRSWGIDPEEFWPVFHDVEDPQARAAASFVYDDAARLIRRLRVAGVPVGVVTHCAAFLAYPVVETLGIDDWFDAFLPCSTETGYKPDPAPVRRVLSELGVDTEADAILLGDGESDVAAAWNAGLDAVHVERHGHHRRGRCVRADHRVRTFDELLDIAASDGTRHDHPATTTEAAGSPRDELATDEPPGKERATDEPPGEKSPRATVPWSAETELDVQFEYADGESFEADDAETAGAETTDAETDGAETTDAGTDGAETTDAGTDDTETTGAEPRSTGTGN
jgi:phosphoglycolate phosphatase